MRTLIILLRKEFILFVRNKFIPRIAFIFPCMVILIIPLVTTMDVHHVGVTVVSRDNSRLTQNVLSDLAASSFFSVAFSSDYADAILKVEKGRRMSFSKFPMIFRNRSIWAVLRCPISVPTASMAPKAHSD